MSVIRRKFETCNRLTNAQLREVKRLTDYDVNLNVYDSLKFSVLRRIRDCTSEPSLELPVNPSICINSPGYLTLFADALYLSLNELRIGSMLLGL